MSQTLRRAGSAVAIGLIVSVLTQIAYMAFLGGPSASDPSVGVTHADNVRYLTERGTDIASVWTTEMVAFSVIAVAGLVAAIRGAAGTTFWVALAIAALFNALQAGMGLSMFGPFALAGEEFHDLYRAVVAGAFFFYFLAKALIGFAAVGFGLMLLKSDAMGVKILAGLGVLSGLAALFINVAALPQGMALTLMAGASGTLATLICGIMAFVIARQGTEDAS